jgi:hypothetical protein
MASVKEEDPGVDEKWNIAWANQLLRSALAEIDELADKLSAARATAKKGGASSQQNRGAGVRDAQTLNLSKRFMPIRPTAAICTAPTWRGPSTPPAAASRSSGSRTSCSMAAT